MPKGLTSEPVWLEAFLREFQPHPVPLGLRRSSAQAEVWLAPVHSV